MVNARPLGLSRACFVLQLILLEFDHTSAGGSGLAQNAAVENNPNFLSLFPCSPPIRPSLSQENLRVDPAGRRWVVLDAGRISPERMGKVLVTSYHADKAQRRASMWVGTVGRRHRLLSGRAVL